MFRRTALTFALLSLASLSFAAQESAPPTPLAAFEPMSFLAGSCWQGAFRDRPAVTDEHCFEWVYGGKFLRDTHVVRGDAQPYEGETLYAWDSESKRIVYWYIARPGFFSTGHVEPAEGRLVFIDTVKQAARTRDLRTTWTRTGTDTFTVQTDEHTGGKVTALWSMEMRRTRAAGSRR